MTGKVQYSSTTSIPPENMRSDSHAAHWESRITHYPFKPRIIVPKHPSRELRGFSLIPIKGNHCILLFANYCKYFKGSVALPDHFLHLSIHKICSDSRVGPALWSFNRNVHRDFNIDDFELIKSTENPLAITFWARFDDDWKQCDISTTETNALDNLRLIESGRIDFDLTMRTLKWVGENRCLGLSEIFMQCWTCSNVFSKSSYPLTSAFV